jgi:hypothetical protein
MRADSVAIGDQTANERFLRRDLRSHEKERGPYVELRQNIEDLRCIRRIGPVVECQCDRGVVALKRSPNICDLRGGQLESPEYVTDEMGDLHCAQKAAREIDTVARSRYHIP